MGEPDIRWMQRFHNLEKAFHQLTSAVQKSGPSDLEKGGDPDL